MSCQLKLTTRTKIKDSSKELCLEPERCTIKDHPNPNIVTLRQRLWTDERLEKEPLGSRALGETLGKGHTPGPIEVDWQEQVNGCVGTLPLGLAMFNNTVLHACARSDSESEACPNFNPLTLLPDIKNPQFGVKHMEGYIPTQLRAELQAQLAPGPPRPPPQIDFDQDYTALLHLISSQIQKFKARLTDGTEKEEVQSSYRRLISTLESLYSQVKDFVEGGEESDTSET